MAYNERNLNRIAIGGESSARPGAEKDGAAGTTRATKYMYSTADAAADVEADGYFDGALSNGLKKGDQIDATLVTGGNCIRKDYVVRAGGADVTVVAATS